MQTIIPLELEEELAAVVLSVVTLPPHAAKTTAPTAKSPAAKLGIRMGESIAALDVGRGGCHRAHRSRPPDEGRRTGLAPLTIALASRIPDQPLTTSPALAGELRSLLVALDGIQQSPRYHPEGDALYHSLQAFDLARRATQDRVLWAAALLHDVGKAIQSEDHEEIGADLLDGLVAPRIVWLVRHHLDLLEEPARTRRRLHGTSELRDLTLLRRCDAGGRSPTALVPSLSEALADILHGDIEA